jgi:hypothetical protein
MERTLKGQQRTIEAVEQRLNDHYAGCENKFVKYLLRAENKFNL